MIELKDLCKDYYLGKIKIDALKKINMEIKSGEFICIAGNSGSGKTTLLNILGCLDTPTAGSYKLNNQEVTEIKDKMLYKLRRNNFGFVFQDFNLISVFTAYENIEYPLILSSVSKKKRKDLTDKVLADVGLFDRKNHKPKELSGGQQQRVAIARALVKMNPIIFADEPTANLDSNTSNEILKLMKSIREKYGTTFIFSSHDKYIIDQADKTYYLKDGILEN